MWFTHYHTFQSEGKEDIVNGLYQWVLKLLRAEDGITSLFWVFMADKEVQWEAYKYFHEYSQNDAGEIVIWTDKDLCFTKTARKKYDIAVVLAYVFDDWLSWVNNPSRDYDNVSEGYIREINDWFSISRIHIKANLWRYIQAKLDETMYTTYEIDEVCKFAFDYAQECVEMKKDTEDGEDEDEDDIDQEEKDEEDIEEISDRIANGFTSGITWNGRGRRLELD